MTPELLGPQEIADLLNVKRSTVDQWRWRAGTERGVKPFPEPDLVISGNPIWERSTVMGWAEETGRGIRGTNARSQ